MTNQLRIATFNLENLDYTPGKPESFINRMQALRPQLLRLDADILNLQEIQGQEQPGQKRQLLALDQLMEGTPYEHYHRAYTLTKRNEAYDKRNLVVLSRYPIIKSQQIKHELTPKPYYKCVTTQGQKARIKAISWERPVFYVCIDIGDQKPLHVINLHLKSKLPATIKGQQINRFTWRSMAGWAEGCFLSTLRRLGQALETRMLIDTIFDQDINANIVICGDFNAEEHSVTLDAIMGSVEDTRNPVLSPRHLVACERSLPKSQRFSLLHQGKGEMIDHILISKHLLSSYQGLEIHNENLVDESQCMASDVLFPESDHAPVVAQFKHESLRQQSLN